MNNKYELKKINSDNDFQTYINVTGITGLLEKPQLKQWSSNMAIKYIKDNCKKESDISCVDETIIYHPDDKLLESARYAHKQRLNETADIGSELHKLIESFINIKIDVYNDTDIKNTKDIEKKCNNFLNYTNSLDYKTKQMFYQFYIWQRKNVKRFIASEMTVCHQELCYAGTLDFIYEGLDGKIYCCDLKTSNNIYKEHELQCISYKYARESMEGSYYIKKEYNGQKWQEKKEYNKIKIDKCSILNISRDFFDLDFKVIKDQENLFDAFKGLLIFYYAYAKRQLNNKRAKERT